MEDIERVIQLREEAIRNLVDEKEPLEIELGRLNSRLLEINEQLAKLGYGRRRQSSSKGARWPRGKMEDGLYRGNYKGQTFTLRVVEGTGTVDGIEGEFYNLSRAAAAVKKAITGREIASRGPTFWEKIK
jgi:hypothetical protein